MNFEHIEKYTNSMICKKMALMDFYNVGNIASALTMCNSVYYYSTSEINPFTDNKNLHMKDIKDFIKDVVEWPPKRGKLDLLLVNVAKSTYDVSMILKLWMPVIRKYGKIIITNATEDMKATMVEYTEAMGAEFYDIELDEECGLLVLTHK